MKQRCENPNNNNYKHYGQRGITCEYKYAIDLYMDFAEELQQKIKQNGLKNATFDRIDVNKGYYKDNLRITTQKVQCTNTTKQRIFIIEKDNERIIGNNAMEVGRQLNINGRSLGNMVRGSSKSAGG